MPQPDAPPSSSAAVSSSPNPPRLQGDSPSAVHRALKRLGTSRQRLQDALLPSRESNDTSAQGSGASQGRAGWIQRYWQRASTVLGALRMGLRLTGGRARHGGPDSPPPGQGSGLTAFVQRQPLVSVTSALMLGAAVAWARPWRWRVVRMAASAARLQVVDMLISSWVRTPLQEHLSALMAGLGTPLAEAPPSPVDAPGDSA